MNALFCEVCDQEIIDEVQILNSWLDGTALCLVCEEDMDSMMEAEEWNDFDNEDEDDDEDEEGAEGLNDMMALPWEAPREMPKKSIANIKRIAKSIVDNDELLSSPSTWAKYGIADDMEMRSLVTKEVMVMEFFDGDI